MMHHPRALNTKQIDKAAPEADVAWEHGHTVAGKQVQIRQFYFPERQPPLSMEHPAGTKIPH